jgi:hypothetical protein
MWPTFLPGGVFLETAVGLPSCWWEPPPNGWLAAFMATPLTVGHLAPLTLYL